MSFGDGTSQVVYCGSTVTHTYTAAGTYTATLSESTGVLSTVTITVTSGGGGSGYLTATPTSGSAPLTVTFTDSFYTSPNCNPGADVILSFGDGTQQGPLGACNSVTVPHAHAGARRLLDGECSLPRRYDPSTI